MKTIILYLIFILNISLSFSQQLEVYSVKQKQNIIIDAKVLQNQENKKFETGDTLILVKTIGLSIPSTIKYNENAIDYNDFNDTLIVPQYGVLPYNEWKIILTNTTSSQIFTFIIEILPSKIISIFEVEKESVNGLKLSPNPVKNILNIEFKKVNEVANVDLQLISSDGKVLIDEKSINSGMILDLQKFQSGFYIIKVGDRTKLILRN